MSDQQFANSRQLREQIVDTVTNLNKLIYEAATYGLTVDLKLIDVTTFADPVRIHILDVQVRTVIRIQ